jgi:hypothetical protein
MYVYTHTHNDFEKLINKIKQGNVTSYFQVSEDWSNRTEMLSNCHEGEKKTRNKKQYK